MQEDQMSQTPIVDSPQTTVMQTVNEKPKKNNFLVILLSILLLVACVMAGFFAYQTQKLANELRIIPTSTPTASTEPTADPTADWMTYKNTSSNYEIKYPAGWKVVNQSAGSMGVVVANSRYIEIGLGEGKSGTVGIEELQLIPPSEETNLNTTKVVGSIALRCNGKFTDDTKTWCWIKVPDQEKYLNIQVFKTNDGNMNSIIDQIISTFRFLDEVPESTKTPSETLKYNLPQGWSTVRYYNNAFELGYDPSTYETKVDDIRNDKNSLWVVKKDSTTPYSNSFIFSLLSYDGGSRHKFIYNQIGETPTKDDLFKDYKELEYNISGKSCLVLDGITISQYPVVWAMCAVGDKAVLMTTFDRNNYLSILQTLKIN